MTSYFCCLSSGLYFFKFTTVTDPPILSTSTKYLLEQDELNFQTVKKNGDWIIAFFFFFLFFLGGGGGGWGWEVGESRPVMRHDLEMFIFFGNFPSFDRCCGMEL